MARNEGALVDTAVLVSASGWLGGVHSPKTHRVMPISCHTPSRTAKLPGIRASAVMQKRFPLKLEESGNYSFLLGFGKCVVKRQAKQALRDIFCYRAGARLTPKLLAHH